MLEACVRRSPPAHRPTVVTLFCAPHPIHSEPERMPVIRTCPHCGQKNRIPANHLADTGRCGSCKNPLPPINEPIAADTQLFDEIIQNARVPVLVDFWAEWCGPCHMAAPEVKRVAQEMSGRAAVLKVDTERHPDIAA